MNKSKLRCEFDLDDQGLPRFTEGKTLKSGEALKHYHIKLFLEDAPDDAYSVTYELDPTYYEPVREVFKGEAPDFALKTTTYGDFDVKANVRIKGFKDAVHVDVAEALSETYSDSTTPEIQGAIQEIAKL